MKREDRRRQILDLLVLHGSVKLDELVTRFTVSKMTIHRDLDDLEESGLLVKSRGGAFIETSTHLEVDYRFRAERNQMEKSAIALAGLRFIEPGMSIILNDGTTAALLGELIVKKRPLTVITNNQGVFDALRSALGITLISLGGTYSEKFNGTFGLVTENTLSRMRADISFISAPAITGKDAFHMDEDVLRVKKLMIKNAKKSFLLADHHKFGRTALNVFTDLSAFNSIITDWGIDDGTLESLRESGIDVTVATMDEEKKLAHV